MTKTSGIVMLGVSGLAFLPNFAAFLMTGNVWNAISAVCWWLCMCLYSYSLYLDWSKRPQEDRRPTHEPERRPEQEPTPRRASRDRREDLQLLP